ncbi:MAG TPA: serine/threonine-protein kinase [Polyangia bacterium]|nr:serine/threonine-protein kinase [Polyangia bacterium]
MIGESIGSYQVLRQLGTGAMGEVYLAEHRHLKRKAAVKLLARELVGRPDLLERFFLEARATSAIAHPAIVQVFDCEIDPTGRPYLVMEYLDGETLAAALARRGALPPATAARYARGMADALAAAHDTGVVHRDLKPENVFIMAHPPDTTKIVDFGIAKLEGDFRAGQVHQTRSGTLMGTPLYMSPEQCRDSANLDFRTDLYSLGCVLYEMLTGRPPFTHTTLGDLVVAHMTETPRDVRELNPGVPAALAELTGELLQKDPAARPPSMRAVADRLAAFAAGLTTVPEPTVAPVAAARPPAQTTFGEAAAEVVDDVDVPARRRPLVFAIAAAVVVGLGIGGVIARRNHTPPAAPTKIAAAWTDATGAARTAATGTSPAAVLVPNGSSEKEARGRHAAKKDPAPRAHRTLATAASPEAAHPTSGPPAATTPPAIAAASEIAAATAPGAWEGPWTDPEHHQQGRLYLEVRPGGAVAGWFSNASIAGSYQLAGRSEGDGTFTLTCACPVNQGFSVKATLRGRDGELRGRLTLSAANGVFGQSEVVLHPAAGPAPR